MAVARYLPSDLALLTSLLLRVEKSETELFSGFREQAESFVADFNKLTPQQRSLDGYQFLSTMQGILARYDTDPEFKNSLDQLHTALGTFLTNLVADNLWDVCGAAKRTQVYELAEVPVPVSGVIPT